MGTLRATTPHFVRCIKPNDAQEASLFTPECVMRQIRCLGMLETIEMRKRVRCLQRASDSLSSPLRLC